MSLSGTSPRAALNFEKHADLDGTHHYGSKVESPCNNGSLEEAFGSDGSHKMRAIPETALSNPSEPSPFVYRLYEQLKF